VIPAIPDIAAAIIANTCATIKNDLFMHLPSILIFSICMD
jgi:hypothetical protein